MCVGLAASFLALLTLDKRVTQRRATPDGSEPNLAPHPIITTMLTRKGVDSAVLCLPHFATPCVLAFIQDSGLSDLLLGTLFQVSPTKGQWLRAACYLPSCHH